MFNHSNNPLPPSPVAEPQPGSVGNTQSSVPHVGPVPLPPFAGFPPAYPLYPNQSLMAMPGPPLPATPHVPEPISNHHASQPATNRSTGLGRSGRNVEVAPGVWNIWVKIHRLDGIQRELEVRTDILWPVFHAKVSAAQGVSHDSNVLHVRRSRAPSRKWVLVIDGEGWETFLRDVRAAIPNGRTEVTIEVESQKPTVSAKDSKSTGAGKKHTRDDDLPVLSDDEAMTAEEKARSYEYFKRIKDQTYCASCSNHGPPVYCHIKKGGSNTHVRLSTGFIGKWVHKCMDGKADEFNPPSCLPMDETGPKQARTDTSITRTLAVFDDDVDEAALPGASNHGRAIRESVLNKTYIDYSSPEPPEPSELYQTLTEKQTESLLVVYPTVEDGLEALDAAKPAHNFRGLTNKLKANGYEYIDELAEATPEELVAETGIFPPVAREIRKHSVGLSRQVRMEAVQGRKK